MLRLRRRFCENCTPTLWTLMIGLGIDSGG